VEVGVASRMVVEGLDQLFELPKAKKTNSQPQLMKTSFGRIEGRTSTISITKPASKTTIITMDQLQFQEKDDYDNIKVKEKLENLGPYEPSPVKEYEERP